MKKLNDPFSLLEYFGERLPGIKLNAEEANSLLARIERDYPQALESLVAEVYNAGYDAGMSGIPREREEK